MAFLFQLMQTIRFSTTHIAEVHKQNAFILMKWNCNILKIIILCRQILISKFYNLLSNSISTNYFLQYYIVWMGVVFSPIIIFSGRMNTLENNVMVYVLATDGHITWQDPDQKTLDVRQRCRSERKIYYIPSNKSYHWTQMQKL